MGTTQLEIIRRQAQAAVQNKVSGAQARIRRETSLVAQASRLTGRALREGETALKGRRWAAGGRTSGTTVETAPAPVHPAEDGYIRRSPNFCHSGPFLASEVGAWRSLGRPVWCGPAEWCRGVRTICRRKCAGYEESPLLLPVADGSCRELIRRVLSRDDRTGL